MTKSIINLNLLLAMLFTLWCTTPLQAAEQEEKPMKWVNALELRMINKGFDNSLTPYTRIPSISKTACAPPYGNAPSAQAE